MCWSRGGSRERCHRRVVVVDVYAHDHERWTQVSASAICRQRYFLLEAFFLEAFFFAAMGWLSPERSPVDAVCRRVGRRSLSHHRGVRVEAWGTLREARRVGNGNLWITVRGAGRRTDRGRV